MTTTQPTLDLLSGWTQQHGSAVYRVFHDKKNHANALVGIGGGTKIVRDIPARAAWKGSWLDDAVYERA